MSSAGIRRERLGPIAGEVAGALAELDEREAVRRLWERDHTLWSSDPTELSDRMGWLEVAADMVAAAAEIDEFVAGCRADGVTDAVVMGMGGSSLFPEVIAASFAPGAIRLHVLDSTDPAAVGHVAAHLDPETTLFVASSKSGSTVETRSHLDFFWERDPRGDRFAVVTDPGSALGALARERGFRHVFENRPDIGGRYSALSFFGLVPAALAGVDWAALAGRGLAQEASLRDTDPAVNVGLRLGAAMGAAVRAGRDKLTLLIDPSIEAFGLWLEQLLAESTGKQGTGVVPVADEALGPVDVYGDDRLFVSIGHVDHPIGVDVLADAGHPVIELDLGDALDLGAHVIVWEVATALCGAVLGINPFDQPNVAEAKEATNAVLESGASGLPTTTLAEVLLEVKPGDYLSIQAYVDPNGDEVAELQEIRLELRDELQVATTFGLGPRFLHSTGQLHKGGPPTGVFLQVVGADATDAEIPGRAFTFSQLKHAQADGDLLTLARHGLRSARVTMAELAAHVNQGEPQ
ncbi:glucose-6-phosphate isomerase [Aquihabitans sp. McL0605]|uniref:glucose-6-phosphate isomerase n=1 Tax=Aquihabitans sp. McL0605 TaxID=3415671 RepID=UPI003CF6C9E2